MAENSKIQWTDHTFNPWEGCAKVSAGCANCYAETRAERFGTVKWGKGQPRRRTSAANWKQPLKWNRDFEVCQRGWEAACEAERDGLSIKAELAKIGIVKPRRPRVFCASLADWLDDEIPIEWLADLLALIHATPNLDWLLLTKRPENWDGRTLAAAQHVAEKDPALSHAIALWRRGQHWNNVWLGVSTENQEMADRRIPILLSIPANVLFLSVEPMLGPVAMTQWLGSCVWGKGDHQVRFYNGDAMTIGKTTRGIDWAIFGGESGPNARPCNVEWIRDGVRQCRAAGVKAFVKQLGSFSIQERGSQRSRNLWDDKKGGNPSEWPDDLRVREVTCPAQAQAGVSP